jgi:hypothetical protein
MPKASVTNYRVEWNAVQNKGIVEVQIGAGKAFPVPIESSEEFIAVMLMMGKSPVYFDTVTRDLECGPRSVGT